MKSLNDNFTTVKLNAVIADIEASIPCEVARMNSVITVKFQGKKILSAISQNGKVWNVRADERLFDAECYY